MISVPESFEAYILASKKRTTKNIKNIKVPSSSNINEKRIVKKIVRKPVIIAENTVKKKKSTDVYSQILNKLR